MVNISDMDYSKLWRTSAYFTILLQFLAPFVAQAVDECSPNCWNPVQENSGTYGATRQENVGNEEECKALCLNTESCFKLDWIPNEHTCWFPTTSSSNHPRDGINHWTVAKNCTGDCAPYCWWNVKLNVQVGGGSYQSNISDENHCKLRCSNDLSCTGIDWDSIFTRCYLLFIPKPPTSFPGVHHWDINRYLDNGCPITSTKIPATTTIKTTTSRPDVTTTGSLATTTNEPTTAKTSASDYTSDYISEASTSLFKNASELSPSDAYQTINTNAIIGGVVAGVCGLILIVILIVCLARKRQQNEKLGEIDDDIIIENDDKKNRIRPAIPSKPKPILMSTPSTDPVSLANLSSHFTSLNCGNGVKLEFDGLPLANYESCSAAKGSDNAKRNRFKNILPYDENRVKLLDQENATSDYVNASYIQGFNGAEKVYIAAQGPLKATLNDFWQMIWNDGLNRIIMIAQLMEEGKSKCDKYWPNGLNETKEFHKVTVTLIECHVCTDYTKRVMRVEHKEYSEPRLVTQLHFTIWNDKSIPTEVYPLLAFRKRVRLLDEDATGPMLVHCSAGVGRTGTFIALDCLLEQAEKTNQVSIFAVVKKLREQRMIMVQVADQYKLLYQAVIEASKMGDTDIDRTSFEGAFSAANANHHFPESLGKKSELEFELLEDAKRLIAVNEKSAGYQVDNLDKNRYREAIPDDRVRIYLSPTANQSDYINAVLAQGHRCPGHYILAQLPLKETIADFWRMIVEHECPTIIVLVDDDQLSIWPSEACSTLQFGKISVQLSSKVIAGELLGLELKLIRRGSTPQIVHLYRLCSWTRDVDLPDSASILDLIGIQSDHHQQLLNPSEDAVAVSRPYNRKPAVVVCLDGVLRSGLFVAASYLIDKMKNDKSVDAYLSCRYVISSRPQAIPSLAQYQYIIRLAAEHRNWVPTVKMDFAAARAAEDVYVNANQSSNGETQPIYVNA